MSRAGGAYVKFEALADWSCDWYEDGEVEWVVATRGAEIVTLVWEGNRFRDGSWWDGDGLEDLFNVAQTLRKASAPSPALVAALPDSEVLERLSGRLLVYRVDQEATVPRAGKLTKLSAAPDPGARVLTFADAEGGGFRSVRLNSILAIR